MIAKAEPIIGNQKGASGGRLKAKSNPVITALPSDTVTGFFMNNCVKASATTADITPNAVSQIDLKPKKIYAATKAGIRAITTDHITFLTSTFSCICGEDDIFNKFIFQPPKYLKLEIGNLLPVFCFPVSSIKFLFSNFIFFSSIFQLLTFPILSIELIEYGMGRRKSMSHIPYNLICLIFVQEHNLCFLHFQQ